MIGLFFEVHPRPGHEQAYLDLAQKLRPELERNPGLLFIERYRSRTRAGWMLSHQYWRDEASLVAWRTHGEHHGVQRAGRALHFADYRLRVGAVIVDLDEQGQLREMPLPPEHAYAHPASRAPRYLAAVASTGTAPGIPDGETFESVYTPGRLVTLLPLRDGAEGLALAGRLRATAGVTGVRTVLISRDYGMHERAEAPQVMPAAERAEKA